MDQKKTGAFFKELRKEKGITQEQLAEQLHVSGRTISRWETGHNMPDLDILMEMADYYEVDLRELLDGERKSEKMNKELEETVWRVADYSNDEKIKFTKRMHILFIAGCVSFVIYLIILFTKGENVSPFVDFVSGVSLGISFGMMIMGVIFTSRYAYKIRTYKMKIIKRIFKKN
ncbi:MAG: helix-turn-helix domain-containing protein [Lachnospiraceae bacterium]|nr:helix-turn-helix domain-containing protein [Lachnospiraceae bacterium]